MVKLNSENITWGFFKKKEKKNVLFILYTRVSEKGTELALRSGVVHFTFGLAD